MASSTSPSLSLIHALLLFALLAFASAQQCYYPNGKAAEGGSKDIPCKNSSNACCPQGWECSSNSLCYNPTEGFWGRYTCTDKAWGSSCPNVCTTGPGYGGNEAVLYCSDVGRYCCDGDRSFDCCSADSPNWLPEIEYVNMGASTSRKPTTSSSSSFVASTSARPTTPSTTGFTSQTTSSETSLDSSEPSSTPSAPSSATGQPSDSSLGVIATSTEESTTTHSITSSRQQSSTSAASPSQSSKSPYKDGPNTSPKSSGQLGMIVGLAVGIPLALLALGLLGFACWRRRRNKRDSDVSSVHPFYSGQSTVEKVLEIPDRGAPPAGDFEGPAEMQGSESYTQRYPVKANPFQNRPDLVEAPESNAAWSRETTMMTLPGVMHSGSRENVSPETTNFSPPYSPVSSQSDGHRPNSYSEFSPNIHQGAWGRGQAQEGGVRPVEMEGSRISTIAELPAETPPRN